MNSDIAAKTAIAKATREKDVEIEQLTDELACRCALCCTPMHAMLTDDFCVACERDELQAELATLREAVTDAYEEGWEDGESHMNLDFKYPPPGIAWLESLTRKSLGVELTAEQTATIKEWREANGNERRSDKFANMKIE